MAKSDVIHYISKLLDAGKFKEALSIANEDQYEDSFKDNYRCLLNTIVGKIEDDTLTIKPSLYGACQQMMLLIVEKFSSNEMLLEFIEVLEHVDLVAQFEFILFPLQKLLKTLKSKRGISLQWCLNSMKLYLDKLIVPEYDLEEDERKLLDSDSDIRKIIKIYSLLPSFYQHFIDELYSTDNSYFPTKDILTAFLVNVLGKPMIFIDVDPKASDRSEARLACQTILQDICKLEKNLLKFLVYVENYSDVPHKPSFYDSPGEDLIGPLDCTYNLNMTTLSGLLYCVYSGHFELPGNAIPQVYSNDYVNNGIIYAINHLLGFSQYGPLAKGLALTEGLINRLAFKTSNTVLYLAKHFDLIKKLACVAIFSTFSSIRKNAVIIIGSYINKFDYKGRCILVKFLLETSNHSGVIGFVIGIYKNSINEAFNDPVMSECFKGPQFSSMVKKICHLPNGAESDMMELADQVIAALNLLRFLIIKDTNNVTGIKDMYSTIEADYLKVLRMALKMSKAHYELKLKGLKLKSKHWGGASNISVNVGGNELTSMPVKTKVQVVEQALNGFHLMEGLVARLEELMSLRAGRRTILPLATVPVNNTQRIIRHYSSTVEKDIKRPTVETEIKLPSVVTAEQEEQQYEDNVKNKILECALQFVPKTGWSVESISAGAKAAGYPTITHGLFPNGGGELVHYFNVKCNEQLVAEMKTWQKENIKESKIPAKFVENAIVTRLLMINPYKNTWPKAMAIQSLPSNVPNCLATLLSLVDDICYHSGDRSVDFNWYVRRVGLAGIYKTAELFYLTDKSTNNTATRAFVASRIRDAQLIQSALDLNPVAAAPQTLSAAFVTAKNILGVNTLK